MFKRQMSVLVMRECLCEQTRQTLRAYIVYPNVTRSKKRFQMDKKEHGMDGKK